MTKLDLDAIEARANAATPGPWSVCRDADGKKGVFGYEGQALSATAGDIEFIASARTDVPALIARVRELESKLAEKTYDCQCYATLWHDDQERIRGLERQLRERSGQE